MAKKTQVPLEKRIVLIHYKKKNGINDFMVSTVELLQKSKEKVIAEGGTEISIPYYENPAVAQSFKK